MKSSIIVVDFRDENSLEQAEETVVIEQSTNSAANDNVSHPVVNIQAGDANTVDK